MLNASVGVEHVLGRLRRPRNQRPSNATALQVRRLAAVQTLRQGFWSAVSASHLVPARDHLAAPTSVGWSNRRSLTGRLGSDHAVAIVVAAILLGASVVSMSAGGTGARAATGGTTGRGTVPRIAIGGEVGLERMGVVEFGRAAPAADPAFAGTPVDVNLATVGQADATRVEGPFLDDGTLLKPVAVDTTVADGSDLLRLYTVQAGDTLTGIARGFGVSMMTVWWANNLKSKDLHPGQVLRIPPVSGLIITVAATDTLDGLAQRFAVNSDDILATNQLEDANLVVGQILVIPGAAGKAMPPARLAVRPSSRPISGGSRGVYVRQPSSYEGGRFLWPVVGGDVDRAVAVVEVLADVVVPADAGTEVRAGGAGTVAFAGWKSNGGGYQVWIAHGSDLYTTYNHMSAITVGTGEDVASGQTVGRVGQSGHASGPHLHFEVWRGMVWDGGQRLNPLAFL